MTKTITSEAEAPEVTAEDWAAHDQSLKDLTAAQAQVEKCMRVRDEWWAYFMDCGLSRREVAARAGVSDRSVTLALQRLERDE